MRILGYLDHPRFKITVFRTDNRIAIQFEDGALEQTYRFRLEDRLASLEDVRRLVDAPFLESVERIRSEMLAAQSALIDRQLPPREEDFPTII